MAFHSFFILFLILCVVPCVPSLPFVVLPGLGADCSTDVVRNYTETLENLSGSPGYCIEVGACDSFFIPMDEQVRTVCDKVKEMDELKEGYNLFAISQGNMVGRGVIEFCDDAPPVKNYISLGGPHAGVACIPLFEGLICSYTNNGMKGYIYGNCFQNRIAPVGYFKMPDHIDNYLENCTFLPKLNNERPNDRNGTYKTRFSSLQKLLLIMSIDDEVLKPKETSWFGFYKDGSYVDVVPANQTKLYTEDWIGLKELDEEGKVEFLSVRGKHAEISVEDMEEHVVPLLEDKPSASVLSVSKSKNENRKMVEGLSSFK